MNKKHNSDTEKITNRINFQERPKICLIDIDHNTAEILTEHGFNCTIASFGSQIRVPNTQQGQHQLCRINANLPPNLHEYEIVIIDLKEKESLAYNSSEHRQNITKDSSQHFFICQYPQTIFDPIPLGGYIAENDIKENRRKESIIVVFADQKYSCAYLPGELTPYGLKYHDQFEENNYSFLPSVPIKDNKSGFETNIVPGSDTEFRDFLRKYNKRFIYEITFFHPTRWDKQQKVSVRDEKLIPLATNSSDELISYAYIDNESILFVFPQLEEKTDFLVELFQTQLPTLFPNLFPFSTEFAWVKDEPYRLPNEKRLLAQKAILKEGYQEKLRVLEKEIETNHQNFQFLHDLVTETGNKLVQAVEEYFNWLGFEKVINCDEAFPGIKEEDLQIEFDKGLLVIEVKGLGGTSKDSECAQISKIKHRRAKERDKFDVFALYIVNHQRHQAPESRTNPPFTLEQIQDAESDERGLLTTYELFKLYHSIESGFIQKKDARERLLDFGLISFTPSNAIFIGKPQEIHYNGLVGIFKLENTSIKVGEELIVSNQGRYTLNKIQELKDQDKSIIEVSTGEIGIKFSDTITEHVEFWKKAEE